MERSLKSFVLAVAVIVCLGLSSTPASAKKTIRITNVPMQVTSAELQRRIQYLEAQVNTLNSRTTALVSNKTQTQVQIISGNPASNVQQGGASTVNYSNVTGSSKPDDNATVGAQLGANLTASDGAMVLSDSDVITSQGTAAGFHNQGALATQSTQGLSFSNLSIHSYPLSSGTPTQISVSFGAGMVLQNPTSGITVALPTAVSGQILDSAVSGAGGLDTGTMSNGLYFIYETYDPDATKTPAVLMSLSATPVLPAGYNYLRWIGVAAYGGSSFLPFTQSNYDFFYLGGGVPIAGPVTSTNLAEYSVSSGSIIVIPPNALAPIGFFSLGLSTYSSGNVGIAIWPTSVSGASATGIWSSMPSAILDTALEQAIVPMLTSQAVYLVKVGAGAGGGLCLCQGFRLNL